MTGKNWIPNLAGQATDAVDQAVRYLFQALYSLLNRVSVLESKPPATPDINAIKAALQSSGPSPLNINGLIGQLSQPQIAKAPNVSPLPGFDNNLAQDGTLTIFEGVLYYYSTATNPGKWIAVGAVGTIIQTTHAGRASISASSYPIGTLLFETDRTVLYVNRGTFGSSNWVYILGIYYSILSNRPADLGINDAGFLFHSTDTQATQRWDGTTWIVQGELGVMLADTHANRLSSYSPSLFPTGTLFYETDRTVVYRNNGTNWIYITGVMRAVFSSEPALASTDAGFLFYATDQNIIYLWNGTIWSVFATVGVAYKDTHANRAGYTPANFPIGALYNESDRFSLYRNSGSAWVLVIAWYADVFANRPADLGANDVGFQFYSTDTTTGYYWTGAAWVAMGGGAAGVTSLTNGGSIGLSASTGPITISVSDPAWSSWTPSVTPTSGSATTSLLDAKYLQTGKSVKFRLYWAGTISSASGHVVFSAPTSITGSAFQSVGGIHFRGGTFTPFGVGLIPGINTIDMVAGSVFPTGTGLEFSINGVYEVP